MAGQARKEWTVEWEARAFQRGMQKRMDGIRESTTRDLVLVAIDITNRAKELAAVDTGFMRSQIGWRQDGPAVYVFSAAPYSIHVEFGTEKMSPQPFMRPAFAEAVDSWLRKVGR